MSKILLIEDELFVRELYERVLKQAGLEVTSAFDGQAGFELASNMPDLILLDIMLPKLNGIDVLRKLKADDKLKNIPVILLTNLGQESVIKEAIKIGAQGYLMKIRVTPYEIVDQVKSFLKDPTKTLDLNVTGTD